MGTNDGPIKEYNDVDSRVVIPIQDIVNLNISNWFINVNAKTNLRGYGYSEEEAKEKKINESVYHLDDSWFVDKFGLDYMENDLFLYYA